MTASSTSPTFPCAQANSDQKFRENPNIAPAEVRHFRSLNLNRQRPEYLKQSKIIQGHPVGATFFILHLEHPLDLGATSRSISRSAFSLRKIIVREIELTDHRRLFFLGLTAILLVGAFGLTGGILRSSLLPEIRTVQAAQCPTAGANPCFVVQLNARSSPVPTAGQTCAAQTSIPSQLPACYVAIRPTSSNATTFRVGAVFNASAAGGGLGGVFGWQFALNYNTTLVTAIADPSTKIPAELVAPFCSAYPECAEKTVWFGSQLTTGTANWAGAIQGGTGATAITLTEDPVTHAGKIFVAFTFLAPALPVTLTARTVLANVAFAIVKGGGVTPPVATITLSDVLFSTQAGTAIPGIQGSSPTVCRLTPPAAQECGFVQVTLPNSPPTVSFTSVTHTGTAYTFNAAASDSDDAITSYTWDFGDKTALVTTAGGPTSTATHDYGINGARSGPGRYNVTVRVIDAPTQCATAANCYTPGATGAARDSSGFAIVNVQPSHQFSNLGLVEIGPQPSFPFTPAPPTAGSRVTFNATSSRYPDEPILKNATPAAGTALTGTAGGDATCTPTLFAPCPVGFVDNNANAKFDPGIDTIVRAEDGATTCNAAPAGPCIILAGPTITPAGQPIIVDGKIAWADTNLDGIIDPTETIVYDQNSNLIYDGIKTYSWNFGDPASGTANTATGITATHTFNPTTTTTFTVTLTTVDNVGGSNSTTRNVPVSVVSAKHNTTTTVSCLPSTVAINQGTTCTATVTDTNASPTTPTGSVSFTSSGTGTFTPATSCTLSGTGASASCSVTYTPGGTTARTDTITANYAGDTGHNAAPAATTTVSVTLRSTSTTVTCSSPVVISQGSTCTASVSDTSGGTTSTPAGTVSFTATGAAGTFTPATSCTLSAGSCSVTFTPSASGTSSITGVYASTDSIHAASTSAPSNITVNKRATTTAVSCTSPVVVSQASTCTATVTGTSLGTASTPTGTVSFTNSGPAGTLSAPSCTLASGSCSVTFTGSATGTATVSATYGGDSIHSGSGPTSFPITVNPRATSTSVSCVSSTTVVGNATSCTATVADTSPGTATTPTGTVSWTSSGAAGTFSAPSCTLSAGKCTVTFTPSATGTSTVTGTYNPDAIHATSQGSATVTVNPRQTTTTVSCVSPVVIAQGSLCTATITDSSPGTTTTPTGTVSFTTSGTATGAVSPTSCVLASGSCSVTFTATLSGTATVTGTYGGDTIHAAGAATPSNTITVNKRSTNTVVTCPPTGTIGTPATCSATVTDTSPGTISTPTGTITWSSTGSAGSFSAPTCTLVSGTCSVTFTPSASGTATIRGDYGGDATHATSFGTSAISVGTHPTTTTLSCSPTAVFINQATSCTATVKDTSSSGATTPTGSVSWTSSGTGNFVTSPCTLATLNTTTATCSVTYTQTAGTSTTTITGTYSGDSTHSAGLPGTTTITVNLRTTSTSITCGSPVVANQGSTCTATVTDIAAGTTSTPTGTVTWTTSFGSFSSTTCTLVSGSCSVTLTAATSGSATVSATYGGDPIHATSIP